MDLCQLESTADLLAAETEAQREQVGLVLVPAYCCAHVRSYPSRHWLVGDVCMLLQAVAMMDGGPSSIYNRWRKELLGCLSSVEVCH
jgi:tRNA U34 5-carboxymethylaminomethyl modifying GTPase MnmE/TrmE